MNTGMNRIAAAGLSAGARMSALSILHGGADTVVSVRNAHAAVQARAVAAGAAAGPPLRQRRGSRHPMLVTAFRAGTHTTVAQFVEIDRLGHAWSGGAAGQPFGDTQGPDTSRLTWSFIARPFVVNAS